MIEVWWVSCHKFTVKVCIRDERIIDAAPIVRRFKGQPLDNLLSWMKSVGGLTLTKIGEREGSFKQRRMF